jgi:hypothetical protein
VYRYASANPVGRADPSGLIDVTWGETDTIDPSMNSLIDENNGETGFRINIYAECKEVPCGYRLLFHVTKIYEVRYNGDPKRLEHERRHIAVDMNNTLAWLSYLLPAEHITYHSIGACAQRGQDGIDALHKRVYDPDRGQPAVDHYIFYNWKRWLLSHGF